MRTGARPHTAQGSPVGNWSHMDYACSLTGYGWVVARFARGYRVNQLTLVYDVKLRQIKFCDGFTTAGFPGTMKDERIRSCEFLSVLTRHSERGAIYL